MKRVIWLAVLLALGALGYVAAGPYLTIQKISEGIEHQDQERLDAHIDFPVLRGNLKNQLKTGMSNDAAEMNSNPMGALAEGIVATFVDGLVDVIVTPAGLANMTKGKHHEYAQAKGSTDEEAMDDKKAFEGARYAFESLGKCSVYVADDNGEETRFVLTREGFKWKLTNIHLPLDA